MDIFIHVFGIKVTVLFSIPLIVYHLKIKKYYLIIFVLIVSYEALTASGKRVEIHLGDRKLIPADKTIHNIT